MIINRDEQWFFAIICIKIIICTFSMLKNPIFTVVGLNPLGMIFLYVKELGTQVDKIYMASRSKKISNSLMIWNWKSCIFFLSIVKVKKKRDAIMKVSIA